MVRYVLCRNEDGKYVAPSGGKLSYVVDKRDAKKFETREAAKAEACGNEFVEQIECGC